MAEEDEWQWVEIEGQLEFVTSKEDRTEFDLTDNGRRVSVPVAARLRSRREIAGPGLRVRARGLCGGVLNESGQRVAGILWAASPDALTVVQASSPAALVGGGNGSSGSKTEANSALTEIAQLRRVSCEDLDNHPRVRIRGKNSGATGRIPAAAASRTPPAGVRTLAAQSIRP